MSEKTELDLRCPTCSRKADNYFEAITPCRECWAAFESLSISGANEWARCGKCSLWALVEVGSTCRACGGVHSLPYSAFDTHAKECESGAAFTTHYGYAAANIRRAVEKLAAELGVHPSEVIGGDAQ